MSRPMPANPDLKKLRETAELVVEESRVNPMIFKLVLVPESPSFDLRIYRDFVSAFRPATVLALLEAVDEAKSIMQRKRLKSCPCGQETAQDAWLAKWGKG